MVPRLVTSVGQKIISSTATPKKIDTSTSTKRTISSFSIHLEITIASRFCNLLITWLLCWSVTNFQAAHSQTASLAIAGTAMAALTAGGRKVGQQISGRCVRCAVNHGIPQFVVGLFGNMMNLRIYIKGSCFWIQICMKQNQQ